MKTIKKKPNIKSFEIGTATVYLGEYTDDTIEKEIIKLNKLFDEFYRVDNQINQNVKGTGLGLALAQKIVKAHGGEMLVTSVVGEWTSFHFSLPIEQKKQKKNEEQPKAEQTLEKEQQ